MNKMCKNVNLYFSLKHQIIKCKEKIINCNNILYLCNTYQTSILYLCNINQTRMLFENVLEKEYTDNFLQFAKNDVSEMHFCISLMLIVMKACSSALLRNELHVHMRVDKLCEHVASDWT